MKAAYPWRVWITEGLDHPTGLWSLKVLRIHMLPGREVEATNPGSLCKNTELLFQRVAPEGPAGG
jgi:hypothetical protein